MKSVSDFPDPLVDRCNEFKRRLVHMPSDVSYAGSVKIRVDNDYDTPVVRVRFNNNYPPQSVKDLAQEHNMVILTAFVSEEGNLVAFYGEA